MELFLCATLSRYLLPHSAIRKIRLPTPTHSHNIWPFPSIVSPLDFYNGKLYCNFLGKSSLEIIECYIWTLSCTEIRLPTQAHSCNKWTFPSIVSPLGFLLEITSSFKQCNGMIGHLSMTWVKALSVRGSL